MASNPMIKKPDVLSEAEIARHVYKISTSPSPHAFTDKDTTLVGGNNIVFVRVKELLQAQCNSDYKEMLRQVVEFALAAENFLDASICDICYEDDCGGEFTCTKGKDGDACECHARINKARGKLEKLIKQALQSQLEEIENE